jgi:hypothetical protein
MRELELDYQRNPGKLTRLGMIVCAVAVVLLALMLFQYSQVSDESQMLEAKVRQFESKTATRDAGVNVRRDTRTLATEVKQANHVLRMLGMKWDSVFAAVAAAHREGVLLLSFAPEPEKRVVKISAEARSFSTMLEYVQRLEDQSALDAVYLQSHTLQNDNPQKPVRFVITADWLDK